jgi:hypothetical protein
MKATTSEKHTPPAGNRLSTKKLYYQKPWPHNPTAMPNPTPKDRGALNELRSSVGNHLSTRKSRYPNLWLFTPKESPHSAPRESDILGVPSCSANVKNEPSSSAGVLSEPGSWPDVLDAPSSSGNILNEPCSSAGVLSEPGSWPGVLEEPLWTAKVLKGDLVVSVGSSPNQCSNLNSRHYSNYIGFVGNMETRDGGQRNVVRTSVYGYIHHEQPDR